MHKETVSTLRIENQRQKDKIAEERKTSEQAQAELDGLWKKQRELEDENIRISKELQSKKEWGLDVYNKQQSKVDKAKSKNEVLKLQNSSMKEEIDDLVTENQQFKKDIQLLRTTNQQSLRQQMDTSQAKIQKLHVELAESKKVIDTLRKEQREQRRQMDALNERLKHTEGERDILDSDVSAITALNNQQQQQISELQFQMSSHQDTAEEDQIQLEQSRNRVESLENLGADRQRDLNECQQAVIDAEEKLRRNAEEHEQQRQDAIDWKDKLQQKETEIDYWIIMLLLIGGGILAVIGLTIFVLAWKSYKQMSEDMMYQLDVQSEIMRPYEPMPVVPSAHANRLGVHEHPAVRDVFGMKEPWGVTPGEGIHVARITGGKKTTQFPGPAELEKRDADLDVPQVPGPSMMVGLPPPPNVNSDEGSDVVIKIPCDIPDRGSPLRVSVNDTTVRDE